MYYSLARSPLRLPGSADIISSVLIMTSHINLIEASVQARAQWWGAEDTPCSLEGRHSQFQLGLNSEDG